MQIFTENFTSPVYSIKYKKYKFYISIEYHYIYIPVMPKAETILFFKRTHKFKTILISSNFYYFNSFFNSFNSSIISIFHSKNYIYLILV